MTDYYDFPGFNCNLLNKCKIKQYVDLMQKKSLTCGCSVVAGLVRSIDLSRPAMLDPVIHQLQHLLGWNSPVLS